MVWLEQYQRYVTKGGLVYRRTRDGELKLCKTPVNRHGYCYVSTYNNGVKMVALHRLVALAFCHNDAPDVNVCVDHIDRNRLNNEACNLRCCTYSENNYNREDSIELRKVLPMGVKDPHYAAFNESKQRDHVNARARKNYWLRKRRTA